MDSFLQLSGWVFWALVFGYIAYVVYALFIHPAVQALSVTLLAISAIVVNKHKLEWGRIPRVFVSQYKDFVFSSGVWRISCNMYVWEGVFKWHITRISSSD